MPIETSLACDKTLVSTRTIPFFELPELINQLKEQRDFFKVEETTYETLEVNYVCNNCGQKIMNATRKMINCDKCGRHLKEVNPIR